MLKWIVPILLLAQVGVEAQVQEDPVRKKNKVAIGVSHTTLKTAISSSGQEVWLSLPSWSFDYDHLLNSLWGLGLHSDLVIQNFQYEDFKGIVKERKSPLALVLVGTRKLGERFTLVTGGGAEFSEGEETLGLIRLGADYGWELDGNWEFSVNLMLDFKIDAYNAAVLGLAIGKTF